MLKGSQSALYGGQAVGGVIDITSPRADRVDGLANRCSSRAAAFDLPRQLHRSPAVDERGEFALTIARLQTDGFSAAEEADGNPEHDGYETTRVSATGTLYLTDTAVALRLPPSSRPRDGDFDGCDPVTFAPADAPNTYDTDSWGLRAGARPRRPRRPAREPRRRLPTTRIDRTQRRADPSSARRPHTEATAPAPSTSAQYAPVRRARAAVRRRLHRDETASSPLRRRRQPTGPDDNWDAGVFGQAHWSPVRRR